MKKNFLNKIIIKMEEQNLNAFKEIYNKFRNKLINDITNQQMSSNSEDCCLIDELFFSDYIILL